MADITEITHAVGSNVSPSHHAQRFTVTPCPTFYSHVVPNILQSCHAQHFTVTPCPTFYSHAMPIVLQSRCAQHFTVTPCPTFYSHATSSGINDVHHFHRRSWPFHNILLHKVGKWRGHGQWRHSSSLGDDIWFASRLQASDRVKKKVSSADEPSYCWASCRSSCSYCWASCLSTGTAGRKWARHMSRSMLIALNTFSTLSWPSAEPSSCGTREHQPVFTMCSSTAALQGRVEEETAVWLADIRSTMICWRDDLWHDQ